MKERKRRAGLTLLETIIAIFILTITLWSVQFLYVGLLRGTGQGDNRKAAIAQLETTFIIWKDLVRENWIEDDPSSLEAYQVTDTIGEYTYRVDVSGRMSNPAYDSTLPNSPKYLDLRQLDVVVTYRDGNFDKQVKIRGAVAR